MGYAEMKVEESQKQIGTGGRAKAKLKAHLASRGYLVTESDAVGPVLVMVVGMDAVHYWRRTDKDGKDFWMVLEDSRKLSYE